MVNLERVGGLGSRPDDVLILSDCDSGVRKLAGALGWTEELEALWEESNPEKGKASEGKPEDVIKTKDEKLEDEVKKLTEEVDSALKISEDHDKMVRSQIGSRNGEEKPQSGELVAAQQQTEADGRIGDADKSAKSEFQQTNEKGRDEL